MRRAASLLYALTLCASAQAQIVSNAPQAVEVTVYRAQAAATSDVSNLNEEAQGLAMISETRELDLPTGVSTIEFRSVAETIVPQSAKLESAGALTEANFDYRLLSPGELIANSNGQRVQLIRSDPKSGRVTEQDATLLSGPQGVLLDIDGKVEALNCSGAPERLVFAKAPANLTATPTLSATVTVARAGRYTARLSYLALGFDWSADYVAHINPDDKTLNLSGWITLANKQSTTFANAPVNVVAGDLSVNREETKPAHIASVETRDACWPIGSYYRARSYYQLERAQEGVAAPAPALLAESDTALEEVIVTGALIARQRELGDYKLYALPTATTVNARQVKQVQMLDERNVPFERVYVHTMDLEEIPDVDEPQLVHPASTIRMQNKKSAGLGKPLPAGALSVIQDDSNGDSVLAGEQTWQDLPVDLPIDAELGEAQDIWIRRRVARIREGLFLRPNTGQADIEIEVINDKPVAITLELLQRKPDDIPFKIVRASQPHTIKHGMTLWTLRLRPGERSQLRYTIEATEE